MKTFHRSVHTNSVLELFKSRCQNNGFNTVQGLFLLPVSDLPAVLMPDTLVVLGNDLVMYMYSQLGNLI